MTKAELMKAIESYDDDAEIHIGLDGFDEGFDVDKIENYYGEPILVSEVIPTEHELKYLAERFYETHDFSWEEKSKFEEWRELL